MTPEQPAAFQAINLAYNTVFKPARLAVGLVVPIESYAIGDAPTMHRHIEIAQLAD